MRTALIEIKFIITSLGDTFMCALIKTRKYSYIYGPRWGNSPTTTTTSGSSNATSRLFVEMTDLLAKMVQSNSERGAQLNTCIATKTNSLTQWPFVIETDFYNLLMRLRVRAACRTVLAKTVSTHAWSVRPVDAKRCDFLLCDLAIKIKRNRINFWL